MVALATKGLHDLSFNSSKIKIGTNNTVPFYDTEFHLSVRRSIEDARKGAKSPVMWGNPNVTVNDNTPERDISRLSFSLIANSCRVLDTRSLWKFNPNFHHTMVSRSRDVSRTSQFSYRTAYALSLLSLKTRITTTDTVDVFHSCGDMTSQGLLIVEAFKKLGLFQEIKCKVTDDIPVTITDMVNEAANFSLDVKKQIQTQVFKRLKFLTFSSHIEIDDLIGEVTAGVMSVYLHSRPFLSHAHTQNYSRSFVQTICNRIIRAYTEFESNVSVWQDNEGGFHYRNNSINGMQNFIAAGPSGKMLMDNHDINGHCTISMVRGVEAELNDGLDAQRLKPCLDYLIKYSDPDEELD